MNVPTFGGFGVDTSMRKDVTGDRTQRNTRTNIASSFANSDLSVWLSYLIHLIYVRVVTVLRVVTV